MIEKISLLENNTDEFLNNDNLYGSFYLDEDLNEMARFGSIPKTKYEIHIEGGEVFKPHMHICIKTGKNIVLRIELLSNTYFREKDDKKNILNSRERQALNSYLEEIMSTEFGINHWEALCMMWNQYNPGHMIEKIKGQKPDYTEINEPS